MIQVIGRMYLPAVNGRRQVVYETTFDLTVQNWQQFQREVLYARTKDRDITSEVVLKENTLVDISCATIGLSDIALRRQPTKKDRIEAIVRYYNLYVRYFVNENGDLDIRDED